jgi:hypothetical protein
LLLDHLYGTNGGQVAPIEMIIAGTAAALFAWQHLRLKMLARDALSGLTLAVAVYLMLWPTVGFHVAGIDFSYMFQWVPEDKYDQWWVLIGLGIIIKLALPILLVLGVARDTLSSPFSTTVLASTLTAKVVLLSVTITAFSAYHAMGSQQATAMLAELILVMFVTCCTFATMPFRKTSYSPEPWFERAVAGRKLSTAI